MNDLTLRERVALLELEREIESKKLDDIKKQLDRTNDIISKMWINVQEMYPIVKDVTMVREYGSFTWRVLKWIGYATFSIMVSWHFFKEHIKNFLTYIFS